VSSCTPLSRPQFSQYKIISVLWTWIFKLPQTALPSLRVDQKCGSVVEFRSTLLTLDRDITFRQRLSQGESPTYDRWHRTEVPDKHILNSKIPTSYREQTATHITQSLFLRHTQPIMKLNNDQRNAQVFNLSIYLLLLYMFRAFLLAHLQRQVYNFGSGSSLLSMVSAPGADTTPTAEVVHLPLKMG
jgi:hypothetical protein